LPKKNEKGLDIFQLLTETSEKEKRKKKFELLTPLQIVEIFPEGGITINKKPVKASNANYA
jgi:hypothetical protein